MQSTHCTQIDIEHVFFCQRSTLPLFNAISRKMARGSVPPLQACVKAANADLAMALAVFLSWSKLALLPGRILLKSSKASSSLRTLMVNQNLEFHALHFLVCCSLLLLVLATDIQICQELLALCQVLTSVLKIVVAQQLTRNFYSFNSLGPSQSRWEDMCLSSSHPRFVSGARLPLLVTSVLLLSCNIVSVDRTLAVTRKAGITNGVNKWPMNQDNP